MSELGKFSAFAAAVALHKKAGNHQLLQDVYDACKAELKKPAEERENKVKLIYDPFTADEISAEISLMVTPDELSWKGEIEIIFQTIENLQASIGGPCGDWYFTGNYPTPGGIATVNAAYINSTLDLGYKCY